MPTQEDFFKNTKMVSIESIFLTGIDDIDNNPKFKKMREDFFKNKKQIDNKKSLYIIEFEDKVVKIGVSKEPNKRLKTIEHNSGRKIKRSYISEMIQNSFTIEMKLKKMFKQHNMNGEFYDLNYEEVLRFAKKILKENLEENE